MQPLAETQYARSGNVNIAYQVFGDGPLNLVLIPGAWTHVELAWDFAGPMFKRFASFARVAVFDKRGTGLSDRNVGVAPLEDRMDDTRAVMDACGMDCASLLGQSEGGPMALLLAATYPQRVRSLVMYGASPVWKYVPEVPGSDKAGQFAAGMLAAIESGWGNATGWHYFVGPELDVPENRPWVAKWQRNSVSPRDARQIVEMMGKIDVRATLPLVTCPTLVIAASEDAIAPPETCRWVAGQMPNARYEEVKGPHFPIGPGQLDRYLDVAQEFLTGVVPTARVERALATVVFTDIVTSTEMAARLGDREWRKLLERHDQIASEVVRRHGGRMVKSTGDGIVATFDGPGRAVHSARELMEATKAVGLGIRVGVHTGEVELRNDGDIAGIAVHLASRVQAAADPGEILVSRTVTDLTFGSGIDFESRGIRELKGVPGGWELFAVR